MINKYLNGKIYMIKSENYDKIYIGSTTKDLDERLKMHEYTYNHKINKSKHYMTSQEVIKRGKYFILLLCNASVETKKELLRIEGDWIRKYRNLCVNKYIAGRTKVEYCHDNKEVMQMKRLKKELCPCGKIYTIKNKKRHFASPKHQKYELNKTKI